MSEKIKRKIFGPRSKYDDTLPYTYMAKVRAIEGDDELFSYYFADTICGLIKYLHENDFKSEEVELYGLYQKKDILLEKKYCISGRGEWLRRPEICRSLEQQYNKTLEEQFKGHIEKNECSFEDRDRKGSGPY